MKPAPYVRAPDSFWLRLPQSSKSVAITPFESAFGTTDENLCYYEGVLIGLAAASDLTTGFLVSLLPTLDRQRSYPWPSDMLFQQSVASLLRQAQDWTLVCEQDCDQVPLAEVRGFADLLIKLSEASAYSKGEANGCPSFTASSRSLDA